MQIINKTELIKYRGGYPCVCIELINRSLMCMIEEGVWVKNICTASKSFCHVLVIIISYKF